VSLGLSFIMLSDHLLYLRSGLKENAVNPRAYIKVMVIVLFECERLISAGNAIALSFDEEI
jgi:hypothetical protein